MSRRKDYAQRFVESAEVRWGKDFIQPSVDGIEKIGEAIWDVDNFKVEPVEKPKKRTANIGGI